MGGCVPFQFQARFRGYFSKLLGNVTQTPVFLFVKGAHPCRQDGEGIREYCGCGYVSVL